MRIVIETDSESATHVTSGRAETPQPSAHVDDAGAGPAAAGADADTASAMDSGGPPDWLTSAIAQAMSENASDSGNAPATSGAADADDAGKGPT